MRPAAPAPVPADKRSSASAEPRLPQSNPQTRIDAAVQRSRDADARQILEAELLKAQANVQMVHVPFKGIPEALTDTIAGRTHLFISPYASAIQLVKDGKAKAVAVTSTQRMAETPDLPTVAEAGLPGYKWVFWYGLLAPAKTPRAVLDKINADLVAVLRQPEVRQRFGPLGIEPATNTPDEMDKLIADEVLNFKKLAAAAQIQID
jgi:tripartite-type tricarboxylate transporter receptor subunit TctC